MIPPSSGRAKRGPNIFFATIGVPLANVSSANNCSMCKKCILAGYLSPRRCATPHPSGDPAVDEGGKIRDFSDILDGIVEAVKRQTLRRPLLGEGKNNCW